MASSAFAPEPSPTPQQRHAASMAAGGAGRSGAPGAPPDASSSSSPPAYASASATLPARGSPFLPTPRETLLLAVFPALLLFGALFNLLSPQTRAAAAAAAASTAGAAHYAQGAGGAAPSYFARKDNIVNVFFVKRGWFWISVVFALFVGTQPSFAVPAAAAAARAPQLLGRRASAVLRWGLVTGWWLLVTQWCFGPPLIDRSFRLTGGGCEALQALADEVGERHPEHGSGRLLLAAATASACKHAGGRWRGGHDISGHVFMLVLGTTFLAQEAGWVLWRQVRRATAGSGMSGAGVPRGRRLVDARSIVAVDGAVKSAEVEAGVSDAGLGGLLQQQDRQGQQERHAADALLSRIAVRAVGAVVGLGLWMLLMTAIYFHTWSEKLTGLVVALAGLYGVYIVPRFVPAVRRVVGLPGL